MTAPQRRFILVLVLPLLCWAGPLTAEKQSAALKLTGFGAMTAVRYSLSRRSWNYLAPYVESVAIPSSADRTDQLALYYDSGSDRPKPLLVVLHSWSHKYDQKVNLPYAVWARNNDWVFIAPNYRGRFDNPLALSGYARQDILDAVKFARTHAQVDSGRIYIVGYSGGATMALLMAARYRNKFAAVVAWSPVFDLNLWYDDIQNTRGRYPENVRSICGGVPLRDNDAFEECRNRSPSSYLSKRSVGRTHVFIGTGIDDDLVDPIHSLAAYNKIVPNDEQVHPGVLYNRVLAPDLQLEDRTEAEYFFKAGRPLILARESGRVSLRLYSGRHDVIYDAGLAWLSDRRIERSIFARIFD